MELLEATLIFDRPNVVNTDEAGGSDAVAAVVVVAAVEDDCDVSDGDDDDDDRKKGDWVDVNEPLFVGGAVAIVVVTVAAVGHGVADDITDCMVEHRPFDFCCCFSFSGITIWLG